MNIKIKVFLLLFITVIAVNAVAFSQNSTFVGTWTTSSDNAYWKAVRINDNNGSLTVSVKTDNGKVYKGIGVTLSHDNLYWEVKRYEENGHYYQIFGHIHEIDNGRDCKLGSTNWYPAGIHERNSQNSAARIQTDTYANCVEFKLVPNGDFNTLYVRHRADFSHNGEKLYYTIGDWIKCGDYTDW